MARLRQLRYALTISIVVILSSLAAGLVASKRYWGYWWTPPNDRYPYYEAAFAVSPFGELRPLEIHHFFFDVAGIEGATAREFAIAAAIPLTFIGMLAQGVLLVLTRR